jgi:glutathione-regulated potassium-efflux system ancillary protein KefG
MSAISAGGSEEAYRNEGRNRFSVMELLAPFNQTAYLCSMAYLTPFVIYAGRRMASGNLSTSAEGYRDLIVGLRDGLIDPLGRLAPGFALPPAFKTGGR